MNYRHAYHAGNFGDVLKHTVFALIIEYLKRKPAPFRIIDTHAGRGRYALNSEEAAKSGEWQGGIGRLLGMDAAPLPAPVAALLAPYLDAVRAENGARGLTVYPGSPLIARRLMRADDALVANELHPEEHARLKATAGRDRRVKVVALDGWLALKAQLPPKERRGLILIDPPFEADGELERMAEGLGEGLRRFATGVYVAWYPIKDPKPVARLHRALAAIDAATHPLRIELMLRRPVDLGRLNGCGLVVLNPPHTLRDDLLRILPELTRRLRDREGACFHLGSIDARMGKV
ncbi:MAG: 23S rRNA (adenine(2030)-N(6))-methyltransferase RlmJ [Hyphomicrobiaceae bacterium]|nr:23S rRNA (adenine(2030)-N(6))-methyltransferase RlmJ [Hyphomicrobiaceae bacterium]